MFDGYEEGPIQYCTIVFNGYEEGPTTKDPTHQRQSGGSVLYILPYKPGF